VRRTHGLPFKRTELTSFPPKVEMQIDRVVIISRGKIVENKYLYDFPSNSIGIKSGPQTGPLFKYALPGFLHCTAYSTVDEINVLLDLF
jgi:hypothetical protein